VEPAGSDTSDTEDADCDKESRRFLELMGGRRPAGPQWMVTLTHSPLWEVIRV
jgi:hypothetical protein